MKKGINIGSFAGQDLEQNFGLAREAGFDGIELDLKDRGIISLESTRDMVLSVREMAKRHDLELYSLSSGLYWANSLTSDEIEVRTKAEEIVKKQLETAALLGCDTILIIPGKVAGYGDDSVVPYDIVYERALDALSRLAFHAEKYGVEIGMENVWNKFLLSPLEMRDFIDKINHPLVKVYFDAGNALRDGYPEQWVRILGNRIAKVHVKDYKRSVGTDAGFCDLLSGDVDFPAVVAALKETGYNDWVTAELFTYRHYSDIMIYNTALAMEKMLR